MKEFLAMIPGAFLIILCTLLAFGGLIGFVLILEGVVSLHDIWIALKNVAMHPL